MLIHVAVLLVVRIFYKLQLGGGRLETIAFALGECAKGPHAIDIIDADFFDETSLVIVFRSQEDGKGLR